jgi:murein DD-endopeptidase MepM/ murein hydrolase activator NlpD
MLVTAGQKVEKGELIGRVGSTGFSTGNHLHFEVWYNNVKENPLNYISIE